MVRHHGVETKVFNHIIDDSMVFLPSSRPRIPERVSYIISMPRPENLYGIHNNSVNNLRRGLTERVHFTDSLGTRPAPVTTDFSTACSPFLRALRSFSIEPYTLEQVVEHYKGGKRKRYEKAYQSLLIKPFNARKDSFLSTFLKAEKIDFSSKPDPAPRVIQPRHPRFNLHFGKYILPMEWKIYKAIGRLYKYPSVAKGYNAEQLGDIVAKKWKLFSEPIAVSLDASRFDQHVSVEALKFTHSVYRRFCNTSEFKELLEQLYHNRGIAVAKDGEFFYKSDRGRMSGDMDTALGNCLLMSAMVYSYCKHKGIAHEAIDNGDDITVIMEKRDHEVFVDGLVEWFLELGFKMKIENTTTILEQLEFCQMTPICRNGKWVFTRQLKSISKDITFICDKDEIPGRLDMIGTAGMICCSGIPVYYEFYKALKRMGTATTRQLNGDNSWTSFWGKGMSDSHQVNDSTRVSFYRATGLSPERQCHLEELYSNIGASLNQNIEHDFPRSHLFKWLDDVEEVLGSDACGWHADGEQAEDN